MLACDWSSEKGRRSLQLYPPASAREQIDAIETSASESVPCPNRSHARGLVAGVRLRAVLEIRIRATRAVHANVSCCSDVRTSVRFGHNSNYRYAGRRSHGFSTKAGQQVCAVCLRYRSYDLHQLRRTRQRVLPRYFRLEPVQIDIAVLPCCSDKTRNDFCNRTDTALLGRKLASYHTTSSRGGGFVCHHRVCRRSHTSES